MNTESDRGFTLLELMVTVMIVGILLTIGVPNFMEFQRNNAMTAAANDLISAVLLARTEAVKRQAPITLCASADATTPAPTCGVGANTGYIVFVDAVNPLVPAPTDGNAVVDGGETVLLQHAAPTGTMTVASDSTYITFAPTGWSQQAAGQLQPSLASVLFCDDRGNRDAGGTSSARVVVVAPTGRPQIMRSMDDVTAAVAITGGACP
jgi:type IV fimbrial biogenesis protein FimT